MAEVEGPKGSLPEKSTKQNDIFDPLGLGLTRADSAGAFWEDDAATTAKIEVEKVVARATSKKFPANNAPGKVEGASMEQDGEGMTLGHFHPDGTPFTGEEIATMEATQKTEAEDPTIKATGALASRSEAEEAKTALAAKAKKAAEQKAELAKKAAESKARIDALRAQGYDVRKYGTN